MSLRAPQLSHCLQPLNCEDPVLLSPVITHCPPTAATISSCIAEVVSHSASFILFAAGLAATSLFSFVTSSTTSVSSLSIAPTAASMSPSFVSMISSSALAPSIFICISSTLDKATLSLTVACFEVSSAIFFAFSASFSASRATSAIAHAPRSSAFASSNLTLLASRRLAMLAAFSFKCLTASSTESFENSPRLSGWRPKAFGRAANRTLSHPISSK
mmetsp:Transcript_29628/g.47719  ORF Transcript_29628/g.47719 Transcript_29628/m.47719 type:complete len:217 (+) Transcript_29628:133-783(+)